MGANQQVLVKLDDIRAERWDINALREFVGNAPGKVVKRTARTVTTQFWVGDTRVRVTETIKQR